MVSPLLSLVLLTATQLVGDDVTATTTPSALPAAGVGVTAQQPAPPPTHAHTRSAPHSSLQSFADKIVDALQQRADDEGLKGGVRFVLRDVRGLDLPRVRDALLPRLRRGLRQTAQKGAPLIDQANGPLRATIALSEERGHVWCVVVIESPRAPPTTVVAETLIDRELEAALGAVSRQSSGRFVLERIGPLPPREDDALQCPILDSAMIDVDGDPVLELAVLSACDVRVYRLDGAHVRQVGESLRLPDARWPRVALGWLVTIDGERFVGRDANLGPILWAATSAGHSLFFDVRGGRVVDAPRDRVPLRGVVSSDGPHALHWRFGTPVLTLPLVSPGGIDLIVQGLPMRMRDLARLPGRDAWVFITDDGGLMSRDEEGNQETLSPERIGDRFLLVDLDGDGEDELLTSSAASPGEADQLVVRRLDAGLTSSTVLLKSPLGGGSIVSISQGFADYDQRLDVVVLEEIGTDTMVWRLEHAP